MNRMLVEATNDWRPIATLPPYAETGDRLLQWSYPGKSWVASRCEAEGRYRDGMRRLGEKATHWAPVLLPVAVSHEPLHGRRRSITSTQEIS